jgi:hypothetical protein
LVTGTRDRGDEWCIYTPTQPVDPCTPTGANPACPVSEIVAAIRSQLCVVTVTAWRSDIATSDRSVDRCTPDRPRQPLALTWGHGPHGSVSHCCMAARPHACVVTGIEYKATVCLPVEKVT